MIQEGCVGKLWLQTCPNNIPIYKTRKSIIPFRMCSKIITINLKIQERRGNKYKRKLMLSYITLKGWYGGIFHQQPSNTHQKNNYHWKANHLYQETQDSHQERISKSMWDHGQRMEGALLHNHWFYLLWLCK